MAAHRKALYGILLLPFILSRLVACYSTNTCCALAKEEGAFVNSTADPAKQVCGQTYSPTLEPTLLLYVNWTFCSSRCSGIQLSQASTPSQWAAPIVQFILPSVIFSMTIPRRKKIEFDYMFDFHWPQKLTRWTWFNNVVQLTVSLICFFIILIPVVVDSLVWIALIVVGAGNMLVSGLYEAHLDYRLVKYVRKLENENASTLRAKKELLVTLASGNLSLPANEKLKHGSPLKSIADCLSNPENGSKGERKTASRLLNLLGAQSSFGGAVGSPVLFYLGAFIYTILDLRNNPSSEDAAISLSYGIEWMIIVHVAIVSGCLLASNNPSTSAGIVGSGHEALNRIPPRAPTVYALERHNGTTNLAPRQKSRTFAQLYLGWNDTYDTEFQPVSLWSRGTNKMKWIKESDEYRRSAEFRQLMDITWLGWIGKIFIPAFALIVLPPATGGVVAYATPPRGIACRSLTFIVYAGCQVASTTIALVRCAVETKNERGWRQRWFTGWRFRMISSIFWFGSFAAGVVGTTLQIVGVYRTCLCYALAQNWYNLDRLNPLINLAADTVGARDASIYWIWMGSTATVFMAANCYIGWWYQRLIRHRFTDTVVEMVEPCADIQLRTLPEDGSATGASLDSQNSTTTPLLSPDGADRWAKDTTAALDPKRLNGRRLSDARDSSQDWKGATTSRELPTFRISGAGANLVAGNDHPFMPSEKSIPVPRTPRPRANT